MLTASRARTLLAYAPDTGIISWKTAPKRSSAKNGDVAGGYNAQGYIQVGIDGKRYQAHRLAWLIMTGEWPALQIDHINGDRADNRWANLRLAIYAQNQANARLSSRNRSGFRGVYVRAGGQVAACIRSGGRAIHLGHFPSVTSAAEAYASAAARLFGEFAYRGLDRARDSGEPE